MMSAFEIAFAGENGDEGSKHADAIKAVFAKHGITEEMLAADSAPAGDTEQAMVDFIKPIEDRMAFVADMSKVHGDKLKKSLPIQGETKLSDVTEDGATAKGTITFKMLDEDKSDTVHFRKVDGSWGIELTDGP
jgi:hypothetical protein